MLYHKTYGNGIPVYLLHGWALNSRVWDPVLEQLQQHWQINTLDLPGHGKSKPPKSGKYDIDELAEVIAKIIDRPAVIVGWSLGGMIALNIAYRYPQLVEKLVMVASSPQFVMSNDWPCAVQQVVLDGFASDLVKDYRATIMRFLAIQALGSEQAKLAVRELKEKVFINGEPHIDSLTKGLEILRYTDLRNRATQIHCPTQILLGEKDSLIPVCSGEHTRQLIPGSELRIIAGAGHAPFISHTKDFVEQLQAFITPQVCRE